MLVLASLMLFAGGVDARHHSRQLVVTGPRECDVCIQFMDQFLDILLNIVLNSGVIGSCEELCNKAHGNGPETAACDIACAAVGIDEFIKLIEKSDLDPIWMCEETKQCRKNECTSNCAALGNVTVHPAVSRSGGTFNFSFTVSYLSDKVGVSTIDLDIRSDFVDKKGNPFTDGEGGLIPQPEQGTYMVSFPLVSAIEFPDGSDIPYPVGLYHSKVTVCAGACGSGHAGTLVLATRAGPDFTVTK